MSGLGQNDQRVLAALQERGKPMSAYEILDNARSETLKAPVQVYRALQKLAKLGLVHRVEALNAFIVCHDHAHDGLHKPGFVVCRDCGSVREFEDSGVARIAKKAAGPEFAIERVSLEVYGRCGPCQAEG